MRVRVKAADGLRVPVGGNQYIGADAVELERTSFIDWLLHSKELVEVDEKKAVAKPDSAPQLAVKDA